MKTKMKPVFILLLACCMIIGARSAVNATEVATAADDTAAENTTVAVEEPEVPANFTGIYKLRYYKKGKAVKVKGWKKIDKSYYFFKNNKALTGWKYVRDLSGSSKKYKYYFSKNGKLSQNLFKTFGAKVRKKKMKIFVNLTTHNTTIFLWDKKKKDYVIPAKTWVCSTARDGHSTTPGNFHLSKSSASSWFIYTRSNPYHYYQYKVKIHGTNMLFHSEMYSGTKKSKLVVSTYNDLGKNQTTRCIRSQCGNAYLLYRIAKENKHSIPVRIYRSSNKGPFGKKTLANSGGRLKKGTRYDPTDPKLHGFKKVY